MSIVISKPYTPAEAERGKFAVIDTSTLSAMGLTGSYGRYAVLTHDMAGANNFGVLGTSGNPVFTNIQMVLSTVEIDVDGVTMHVESVSSILSPVTTVPLLLSHTINSSINIMTCSLSTVIFSPAISLLEIYNNSNTKVYFDFNPATTFAVLTAKGFILDVESYYARERSVSGIVIGSNNDADVRIFGHY